MNLLDNFSKLAQVVKPYDPSSMPEEITSSNGTESIMPIVIGATIAITVFIVIALFIYKNRR